MMKLKTRHYVKSGGGHLLKEKATPVANWTWPEDEQIEAESEADIRYRAYGKALLTQTKDPLMRAAFAEIIETELERAPEDRIPIPGVTQPFVNYVPSRRRGEFFDLGGD